MFWRLSMALDWPELFGWLAAKRESASSRSGSA
jgi:hypothetical protein